MTSRRVRHPKCPPTAETSRTRTSLPASAIPAHVRADRERREHREQQHRGGLAGAVRPEQAADRAGGHAGRARAARRSGRTGPYVLGQIATGKYPYLDRIVRDAEDFPDPDEQFERRLGYVLDGLAAGLGLT